MTPAARMGAGLVALVVLTTMVVQTGVDMVEGKTLGGALWHQARYFTNLCVVFSGLIFAACFSANRWVGGTWTSAAMVLMVLVGVVYHALLAADHHPEGLDVLVNLSQHTVLPLLVVIVWFAVIPKAGLGFGHPLRWMLFPLGYACYVLLRGAFDGSYPYFFLNPVKSGWLGVATYVAGIAAVYYAISAVFIVFARGRARKAL